VRVGFHVSISGAIDEAVDRAIELGCNTFQIFTRNPRGWKPKELVPSEAEAFIEKVNTYDVRPVFGHMPYLSNLASPRDEVHVKSVEALRTELERCDKLKVPYLVTHIGSHLGSGAQIGFQRIVMAIDSAFSATKDEVTLLLENTAGTKNSMGGSFEDIEHIIEALAYRQRVGICFDTCHAFVSGYDLRTEEAVEETIAKIDETVGFDRVKLIHLNDSVGDFNSCLDRHEHIGLGKIGEEGFRKVLKSEFGRLPLIMETPKDLRRTDAENLRKVRKLAGEI